MSRRRTTVATCLLALAIALTWFQRDKSPARHPASLTGTRPSAKALPGTRRGDRVNGTFMVPAKSTASTTDDKPIRDAGSDRHASQDSLATANHHLLSRAELERRAQLVEQDAHHELTRLIPLLDLKPEQQDRVFQALARTSPNFVPGMQVDGTALHPSTGTSQQTLLAELTDAQVASYLQDSDERSAWWSEYISNATSRLESGTPAMTGSSDTIASTPASDPTAPVETAPAETAPAAKEAHAISPDE